MKDNALQNIENYNKDVSNNEMDVYMKYVNVINQYLLFGIETIKIQNCEYLKYILLKGLFTISYVFKMLLLYTRNLELTYYHCQKSYSYYVEFIGQIGDDAITYLQLNSKDAALFVYKKTIFDIHHEYKKDFYESKMDEKKNNIISLFIDMYNKLIDDEIMNLNPEHLKTQNVVNKIHVNIGHLNDKLYKLYYSFINNNNTTLSISDDRDALLHKLNHIKNFIDIILSKKNTLFVVEHANANGIGQPLYKDYIKLIEYFVKKIRKINIDILSTHIMPKCCSIEFEEKIKSCTVLKLINWIFL